MMHIFKLARWREIGFVCIVCALSVGIAHGQVASTEDNVVVSGTVPDNATRDALIGKLRELYGSARVIDQLSVDRVTMPEGWNSEVQKLLTPSLKQVHRGQLIIDGNAVTFKGQVANEAARQQIGAEAVALLKPTYAVSNGLYIATPEQAKLDNTLGRRIIEFESGSAVLTERGKQILNDMATALKSVSKSVEIAGHTDATGLREANLLLSQARAEAVKQYLAGLGVPAASLVAKGYGPDQPVASNVTPDGRRRNRRIEFNI
jgi:OmpA-OmpF porin, OOP family